MCPYMENTIIRLDIMIPESHNRYAVTIVTVTFFAFVSVCVFQSTDNSDKHKDIEQVRVYIGN